MAEFDRALTPPSKEQVRLYLENRRAEKGGPPSLEEIRRQLGWDLCNTNRKEVENCEAK